MAANYGTRKVLCSLMDLFDVIRPRDMKVRAYLLEDNQAAKSVIESGRNPSMPHIPRIHGLSIAALRDFWSRPAMSVSYERSRMRRADRHIHEGLQIGTDMATRVSAHRSWVLRHGRAS